MTVFLDASVIISALASPKGGSGMILKLSTLGSFSLVTSGLVFQETAKNISKIKTDKESLISLLEKRIITLVPNPNEDLINRFRKITPDTDDAHVLAGAVTSGANFLISLDKKHILTSLVKNSLKPINVLSPKEFWQWIDKDI